MARRGRRWLIPALGLALCLPPAGGAAAERLTGLLRVVELAPGVYAALPEGVGSNAAFVVGRHEVLVMDGYGSPARAQALLDAIREITPHPVRIVINSHWHVDHNGGNAGYAEAFPGVLLVSHPRTRADIPTRGRAQLIQVRQFLEDGLDAARRSFEQGLDLHSRPLTPATRARVEAFLGGEAAFLADPENAPLVPPNLTVTGALAWYDREHRVEVRHVAKGHTAGDLFVYLPDQRILFAGDLLTLPILWTWSSYPAEYVETLRALEELDVERIVPGHGPLLEGTHYLTLCREFVEATVELVASQRAAGLKALLALAARDGRLQAFRRRFVTVDADPMFDQMIEWTVSRAFEEASDARGE